MADTITYNRWKLAMDVAGRDKNNPIDPANSALLLDGPLSAEIAKIADEKKRESYQKWLNDIKSAEAKMIDPNLASCDKLFKAIKELYGESYSVMKLSGSEAAEFNKQQWQTGVKTLGSTGKLEDIKDVISVFPKKDNDSGTNPCLQIITDKKDNVEIRIDTSNPTSLAQGINTLAALLKTGGPMAGRAFNISTTFTDDLTSNDPDKVQKAEKTLKSIFDKCAEAKIDKDQIKSSSWNPKVWFKFRALKNAAYGKQEEGKELQQQKPDQHTKQQQPKAQQYKQAQQRAQEVELPTLTPKQRV